MFVFVSRFRFFYTEREISKWEQKINGKNNFTDQGCYELTQKKNALMDTRLFISKTDVISNIATEKFNKNG